MWHFKKQWISLALGSALAASLVGVTTAAAYAHIYPTTGYSTHTRRISWYDYCIDQQYNYGHNAYAALHGYYPQETVQVQFTQAWSGWENSENYDFEWGATWLIDGLDSRNSTNYPSTWGADFTSAISIWPWYDLDYANPGYYPMIMYQWEGASGWPFCSEQSYIVIHGPN